MITIVITSESRMEAARCSLGASITLPQSRLGRAKRQKAFRDTGVVLVGKSRAGLDARGMTLVRGASGCPSANACLTTRDGSPSHHSITVSQHHRRRNQEASSARDGKRSVCIIQSPAVLASSSSIPDSEKGNREDLDVNEERLLPL